MFTGKKTNIIVQSTKHSSLRSKSKVVKDEIMFSINHQKLDITILFKQLAAHKF